MDFASIKKNTKTYDGALILDSLLSKKHRHTLRNFLTVVLVIMLGMTVFITPEKWVKGVFLLLFAFWIILFLLEFFFNSYYFRDIHHTGEKKMFVPTYELAYLLYTADPHDVSKSFTGSYLGKIILFRSAFFHNYLVTYLGARKNFIHLDQLKIDGEKERVTVTDYVKAIVENDAEFSEALFQAGIQKSDLLGATEWVERRERAWRELSQWWSRENLKKIPGLAKDWAYGNAYEVEKYKQDIPPSAYEDVDSDVSYGKEEVLMLEEILTKEKDSNAILVGTGGGEEMEILQSLVRRIEEGKVMPQLEHQRLVLLNTSLLIALSKQKTVFEEGCMRVFQDAIQAGNIILCLNDFANFILSAKALGSDVVSLIAPYIETGRLKIIALSESSRFHQVIETNPDIKRLFETVIIKDTNKDALLRILEHEIEKIESRVKIFFTFQSLKTIEESADRYLSSGAGFSTVLNLLNDLLPEAKREKKYIILPEDILELVQRKTGIPQGKVSGGEKEKLLHLEEILHKRIVGQEEAVKVISEALRRARSDIGNPKRPIGCFLFLGPTGVGKTETTKALAEAFFGSDENILRLDMSEYKGEDALSKLIGSFDGQAGILSSKAREKPYGVLLLDEFEKTSKDVLNLFLSILDEGFFSDMQGKRVNVRNMIIIATSNAGSASIWRCVQNGEKLEDKKKQIINEIIEEGIFKPELLNRFDGVILFHPLYEKDLGNVANLALNKFASRLAERGVKLEITQDLIDFLIQSGLDPQFGARSMNRVIADKVENLVADKMIAGEISSGSKIAFVIHKDSQNNTLEVVVKK